MLHTLQKYNTVFWQFRSMQLMATVERRADFVFWFVVSAMWSLFNVFFFSLILGVSGSIGGWNTNEMYLLLGVFSIVDACTWSVFYFNMARYTNSIYDGELNMLLLKPINPIFILMTRYNNYNNVFRLVFGICLTMWAYSQLELPLSIFTVFMFLICLIASLLCIYFLWFIMSTCAFYFEKLDNINEIIPNARRMWQVPRTIYTTFISFLFTYIIPFGIVVSLPAEVLLGKDVYFLVAYLCVFTSLLIISANLFFKFSVKRYSGIAN